MSSDFYTVLQDGEERVTVSSFGALARWVAQLGGVEAVEIEPALPPEHFELIRAMVGTLHRG